MRARKRKLGALCLSAAAATAFAMVGGGVATASDSATTVRGTILGADSPDAIHGEYIVALKGTANVSSATRSTVQAQVNDLADRYGVKVSSVFSAAFRGFAVETGEAEAREMAADPDVRYVQPNKVVRALGSQPNPPSWGIDRIDGKTDRTYTYPNAGEGVTAYVIDTGTDLRHSNFEGRATSGYDFIDNDNDASDCHGHGTHVAGTIGSKDYGVAKKVDLVAVRVLDCGGSGTTEQIVRGMDWIAKNAKKPAVGNMSLGGDRDQALDDGVKGAIDAGVTMVVAGGNESGNACDTSPARLPAAITLGSTDSDDRRSSFSNYGSCLDLFAPGGQITSTRDGGGSTTMSGTSMASPHAAGAAALYLSAHPTATPQQVRDALVDNAQSGVVSNPGGNSPNTFLDVSKLGAPATPGVPTAAFTPACGETSTTCSFDASASKDPDGSIVSYAWDFGDGRTGSGVKPSHTYAKAGIYDVKLTVTDNDGRTGTVTQKVKAGSGGPVGAPPTARFTVSCWYEECDFDAGRSSDPDGDIASYSWKFGDGKTASGVAPTHFYPPVERDYTAQLTVTDRAGNTGTVSKRIECWDLIGSAFCFGS